MYFLFQIFSNVINFKSCFCIFHSLLIDLIIYYSFLNIYAIFINAIFQHICLKIPPCFFCCCCSTVFNISCSVAIDWLFSLLMLESSCLFGHFILDYRRCECMHDIANPTGILCLFDSLLEEIILFLFNFINLHLDNMVVWLFTLWIFFFIFAFWTSIWSVFADASSVLT